METRNYHSVTDEGVVIKRFNLGEADRLITIFSKFHGKITLKAKGIRRAVSKRAGSVELFNHIRFHAVRGRGELDILTEVQVVNSYPNWRKQLGRITIAYQLCEIIDKVTPDRDPHPKIFDMLTQSLTEVGKLGDNWRVSLESWINKILVELGYLSREKMFAGDVLKFVEDIASQSIHSPKLLNKLK